MRVRPIGTADLPALAAIHGQSFPRPWAAGELWDMVARPGAVSLLIAAPHSDTPQGFILCWRTVDEAEVLTLAVSPARRGLGLGRTLLEKAAGACAAEGAQSLFLEVAEDNAAALGLYRRAGFEDAGRRRGYYRRPPPEATVDALVLKRRLTPPQEALILG